MHLRQHGRYELHWQAPVLLVRYEGVWNEQAVIALHADACALWQTWPPGPWAMLSDATHWDGGTPEVFERWTAFFQDAVRHGMTAVTDVLPSHFHELLVRELAEKAAREARHHTSHSLAEAWGWLATQGFEPASKAGANV